MFVLQDVFITIIHYSHILQSHITYQMLKTIDNIIQVRWAARVWKYCSL